MENQNPKIIRRSVTYDIKTQYHSDLMCQNYDVKITAIKESDGRISFKPDFKNNTDYLHPDDFTFFHSDPDRVMAIAAMMWEFAKKQKGIDTISNL